MKLRFWLSLLGVGCIFLTACSMQPVTVDGSAMMPALSNGDKILLDKNPGELKRGDIVVMLYPKDKSKSYIKRIVGLPKETIEIRKGQTFINDEILAESYVDESFNQNKSDLSPQKIAENQYFVIGDNRDNSSDSRAWGTVGKELITGKYYETYSKVK